MSANHRALIVIDIQNDYFPEGHYPLWNTDATLSNIEQVVAKAQSSGWTVILIKHIANSKAGTAPFFNPNTAGTELHTRITAVAPEAPVVIKQFADSFHETNLEEVLHSHAIDELFICGMMTQNCVTHTAISKAAEKYLVRIISDCCTTVDQMIHNIALAGIANRVPLILTQAVLKLA